jgi:lysine 2,3-aminomutase
VNQPYRIAADPASRALRSAEDLRDSGLVSAKDVEALAPVLDRYALALTPALADLIDRDDPHDPIARQFVPSPAELIVTPEERADPIGDHAHEPVEGVIHRHADRVLLKAVAVCPVYCRFCFRREMVGPGREASLSPEKLDAALAYIARQPAIREVILTGGDPFVLSPRRARALTTALEGIAHVKVVRWHTRMPVADPARVSPEFVAAIRSTRAAVYVAVHANHARELTQEARAACARLIDAGIPMLSQSVLLKGVNDNLDALEALMRALVETRIRPYYLHHPDLAPGTSHFRVTVEEGQALARALRDRVSGLCQPTYVVDIPGGVSKAMAAPSDVDTGGGLTRLRGADGMWRDYPGSQQR